MADKTKAVKEKDEQRVIAMTPATSDLSRPVLHREIDLYSLEAQRIAERLLDRVGYSLFSIEVILQLMADRDQIEEIEKVISDDIAKTDANLKRESERLRVLMQEAGISEDDMPTYTRPVTVKMEISAPLVLNYGQLLIGLDEIMGLVDTLWMNSVLTNRQRQNANYQWQRHLNKLSGRIIDIEGRSRRHARKRGKEKEVQENAPARNDAVAEGGDAEAKETPKADTATEQAPAEASDTDAKASPPAA